MKPGMTKTLLMIGLIVGFSQISIADPVSARHTIAGIVASINHFPTKWQIAELMAIAMDESAGRDNQLIARAVSTIDHSATAQGKAWMREIIADDGAPAETKALAEVVLGFEHMASDEAKDILADL